MVWEINIGVCPRLEFDNIRARKLYTSARIYEWIFGKGEWKLPFACPTGRVDFLGFVIIFEGKKRTNYYM